MTDKITLTNLVNLQNETTAVGAINANNVVLVSALNNTLSRDGTSPNQMTADLDMNSNSILNLPTPTSNYEPLRLIDVATIKGGGITVSPLPAGGTSGQVLEKNSATNYDVSWKTSVGMPAGGTLDQVLSKNSSTDYDVSWKSQTNVFNVLNYGAVGDGQTDSTNAILGALAAAETYATTLGTSLANPQIAATVYIPQGVYYISAPLVIPRAVSLVGDGVSSQILANDCDAIQLSLPPIAGGLQAFKGLWINGQNSTAARNAVFFGGSLSNNDIIAGLLFEDLYISTFDTAFRLSGVQDVWIRNVFAQYMNQACTFTGVVYNTYIQDCTFYSIAGLNPSFGSSYTGLSLYTKNYTTLGGVLPPEGIFLDNANFFGFNIGIDADACDTLQVHHASIVALVYGFRFNKVTTVNNFTDSSIEMHSSTALAGIYGVPLSAPVTSHRTILANNSLQGVTIAGGALQTTQCSGIIINGAGGFYQDNVIIQNNYSKFMNVYDFSCFNPGGNTRIINNYCNSPLATGSIACGTPVSPYELLVQGNTCYLTIDYTNRLVDWPAGTVRSENNTINNGTSEVSSWNVTSPVARFTTFAGPTAARTYTLPDATDTIATIAATQTLTNKTISGSSNTITNVPVANISGLGTGVGTFLATPSSANLAAAVTDETGTSKLVFNTSPTLITPILGTPTSGTLTNCTGLPLTGLATAPFSVSNAVLNTAPANPTGTASTTSVMMGLGASAHITPVNSTRVKFEVTGYASNNTGGDGAKLQLAYGTGTAPINAASASGTAFGSAPIQAAPLSGVGSFSSPFSLSGIATGLTIGTAYWFDIQLGAVTGGTASILSLNCVAYEV